MDWNKKVPHILATGSSGGFVTVWDVKAKKESLTLNVLGRKAVSAVAWDPQNVSDRPGYPPGHESTRIDLTIDYAVDKTHHGHLRRLEPTDLDVGPTKLQCP